MWPSSPILLILLIQSAYRVSGFSLSGSKKLPHSTSIVLWGSADDEEDESENNIDYANLGLVYADGEGEGEEPHWDNYRNGADGTSKAETGDKISIQSIHDVNSALQRQVDSLAERLDKQQQHIEKLVQIIRALKENDNRATSNSGEDEEGDTAENSPAFGENSETAFSQSRTPPPVAPIKAVLFVDGTWLYYSLFEREEGRCPIRQKYGIGWHKRYSVDFSILPRVICKALNDRGWSSSEMRPTEIVRACVFTSYKKDTQATSLRYQMFEEMKRANYDVNQMVTVANKEKCIDIQLAVEMLHLADTYDVAILLTGDKDFLPAMYRTRQKGRKVALVSMRPGCNQALRLSNGIKDYDDIWLEDHLDEFLVKKQFPSGGTAVSWLTIARVLKDYIDQSGGDFVNSRDVGRYLQCYELGNESLLEKLKDGFGGIRTFASVSNIFEVIERPRSVGRSIGVPTSGPDKSFWIKLLPDATEQLEIESRSRSLSPEEESFFLGYNTDMLQERKTAYYYTLQDQELGLLPSSTPPLESDPVQSSAVPATDFSKWTVSELKERCRERGLPMSGLKADLVERVHEDSKKDQNDQSKFWKHWTNIDNLDEPSEQISGHLQALVKEYLSVCGGRASSRDIGRILQKYKSSDGQSSALDELKRSYGSFSRFVDCYPQLYSRDDSAAGNVGFLVIDRSSH